MAFRTMTSHGTTNFFTPYNALSVFEVNKMTIKEKLRLLADVKKDNDKRLTAWIEERKAPHGKGDYDGRKL